jgi:hypothetical protein
MVSYYSEPDQQTIICPIVCHEQVVSSQTKEVRRNVILCGYPMVNSLC